MENKDTPSTVPKDTSSAILSWEAMVDLAWRRVGLLPEIFITPGIPTHKETAVRALHKIPDDEPVLVLNG